MHAMPIQMPACFCWKTPTSKLPMAAFQSVSRAFDQCVFDLASNSISVSCTASQPPYSSFSACQPGRGFMFRAPGHIFQRPSASGLGARFGEIPVGKDRIKNFSIIVNIFYKNFFYLFYCFDRFLAYINPKAPSASHNLTISVNRNCCSFTPPRIFMFWYVTHQMPVHLKPCRVVPIRFLFSTS